MLSSNGLCTTCDVQANDDEILKCYDCLTRYHGICGEERVTPYCKKTFLGNFLKQSKNFLFVCDPCLTRRELLQASDLKEQIAELTSTVSTLAKEFKAFKSEQATQSIETPGTANDSLWRNQSRVERIKTSLCIRNNEGEVRSIISFFSLRICNLQRLSAFKHTWLFWNDISGRLGHRKFRH